VLLKLVPDIITLAPTAPLVGLNPVIEGEGMTVKLEGLVTIIPRSVMVIGPEVAPTGTVAVILVNDDAVTVAMVLLNFTT
jgi:hypothetical protein